jgi:hypothetical protein
MTLQVSRTNLRLGTKANIPVNRNYENGQGINVRQKLNKRGRVNMPLQLSEVNLKAQYPDETLFNEYAKKMSPKEMEYEIAFSLKYVNLIEQFEKNFEDYLILLYWTKICKLNGFARLIGAPRFDKSDKDYPVHIPVSLRLFSPGIDHAKFNSMGLPRIMPGTSIVPLNSNVGKSVTSLFEELEGQEPLTVENLHWLYIRGK